MISFCLLKSGFQRAIIWCFQFLPGLRIFGALDIIVHVKEWLMLLQRYFHGSEILVVLLCSFHPTSALRFWETKFWDFAILWEIHKSLEPRNIWFGNTPAKMFHTLVAKVFSCEKSFFLQKILIIIYTRFYLYLPH